jgi:glycosyltransferase involved in cell wall biosynthesis
LSFASDGGASRAGRRAHLACREAGILSDFAFVEGEKASPSDIVLALPKQRHEYGMGSLTYLMSGRMQWEFIPAHRTSTSNALLSIPYPGIDLASHRVLETADIIHLHWPTWAVTPRMLEGWLAAGRTVFWTLHDFWGMTGGCHYPTRCDQYKTQCMKCPQLLNDASLVPNAFAEKQRSYGGGGALWIVSPSRWLADRARESAIFGGRTITAIPNSIELDLFTPPTDRGALRTSFGVGSRDLVLFFGSFDLAERRKGVALLIQAIEELMETGELAALLPEGAQVHLAVTGKSSAIEAIQGVKILNFGRIEDDTVMADALAIADLACVPSLEDNYPNVIVEAMACGTPCLAFAAGGIPEMIEDGVTGILVEAVGSVGGLKQGLLRFAASHFRKTSMRLACRSVSQERNAPEVVGNQLKELYQSALGRVLPDQDPALRQRVIRAFAHTPIEPDCQAGRDFLQFPTNLTMLNYATDKKQVEAYAFAAPARRRDGARLLDVRTYFEHHSTRSGPYQFVRHLPRGQYDNSSYVVPLGKELTGARHDLFRNGAAMLGARSFGDQSNYWLAESEILIRCADEEVDIVHFIDGEHGGWLLPRVPAELFKNGHRPVYVATFHQPPDILKNLINLRALRHFDAVVTLCGSQRDGLRDHVSPERLHVIPHGIDTEFFHPPGPEWTRSPSGKTRLLLVGHWLRDVDCAYAALDLIAAAGIDVELTVISPSFPARRVDPRVTFRTGVSDEELRTAYWDADILMIPLTDATANNAILEAMACGRPVVSTDVGGVAEAVGPLAGILGRPRDPNDIADGVIQLAKDPERLAVMGKAARRQAESLSWQTIAQKHHALYQRLLAARVATTGGDIVAEARMTGQNQSFS